MATAAQLATCLRLSEWARLLAGPIFDSELRVASRRRRNYLLRFLYMAVLLAIVVIGWACAALSWGLSPAGRFSMMAEVGLGVATFILWFQLLALPVVAVVMTAGSMGDEIYRRSLGVLMTTPVTGFQIVTGKLASRLLQIVLLLAISLPVLCVVRAFGGAGWDYAAAGLWITLAASVFGASLSLFFSIFSRRAFATILKTGAAAGALYVGLPLGASALAPHCPWPAAKDFLAALSLHANPYLAMWFVTAQAYDPTATTQSFSLGLHCLAMFGASALLVGICIPIVRHVALVQITGDTRKARRKALRAAAAGLAEEPGGRIHALFGPPVVWKELYLLWTRRRLRLLVVGGIVLAVLAPIYAEAASGLGESEVQCLFVGSFLVIAMLATGVVAATGLTEEKEAGTWSSLLGTPLSDREIVAGKAIGAVARCLPFWLLVAFHVLGSVLMGYVHPLALFHLATVSAGLVVFIVGLGLACSAYCKRTTSAVLVTLGFGFLLWVILPVVHMGVAFLAAFFHPVVQMMVVVGSATGEEARRGLLDLQYGFWSFLKPVPGVVVGTFLVGLTASVHTFLGLALMRLAMSRLRKSIF